LTKDWDTNSDRTAIIMATTIRIVLIRLNSFIFLIINCRTCKPAMNKRIIPTDIVQEG